ncbi:MAG: hypothetical protein NVS9B12_09930 [Vulcanimicrobiaceae bacterium]
MSEQFCWIHTVSPAEADPALRLVYKTISPQGRVAHILQAQSLDPGALAAHNTLYRHIMFGPSPLSRTEREMIAVAVSMHNHCKY